jgi:NADPH-dependent 2,4-dienoyl-CoA reductase/sulfur reductase-like enzyme
MATDCDLAVIGAGPAGLAAARQAAELGLSVVVLDEQGEPGGQIYRAIETTRLKQPDRLARLGPDYARGAPLVEAMRAARVDYRASAVVWNVDRDLTVNYSSEGGSQAVAARHVLVATGAIERAVPIPGWTLPGVMTAGALQILLKAQGLVPDGRVVLAGCGPLLLLLASQYLAFGVRPAAIVETVPRGRLLAALPHLLSAMRAPEYLRKGQAMLRAIRAAGFPVHKAASGLMVEGDGKAEALVFQSGGRSHRVEAEIVALHQGVVPNQQVTRLLGCAHDWDDLQRCFRPRLDDWFFSSVEGVSVAGDGGGIGGAKAAEMRGRLAALGLAARLGRIDAAARDRRAAADRAALARELAVRPFLDALYAPPDDVLRPADEVLICRCEEVTAGRLREAVRLGCPGPNQAKSFLRCGMGPCQGRLCGLPVTEIIAEARGVGPQEIDYYRIRPPLKPLTLGELAALDESGEGEEAA